MFVCVIKFRSHVITFMDHVIYLFVFLEIFEIFIKFYIFIFVKLVYEIIICFPFTNM